MGSLTPPMELTEVWAREADQLDPLSLLRSEFLIPTLTDIHRPTLSQPASEPASQACIYLCGNSLGVQPKRTSELISTFLTQWKTKGVKGHFVEHSDSQLAPFLHIDDHAAKLMAPLFGAKVSEVAVMGTLTGNLHLLMSSFYRPTRPGSGRWKILLEGKAFPSDHFAIESQIQHWGIDPAEGMVLLEPKDEEMPILRTEDILRKIDEHADELALLLLPGIQFYTGQFFDIKTITAHAQSRGVIVGWDLAHAAGNVELKLHEWNVDFAAWCTYKYMNCGPGAMAALFVHEKYNRPADGGEYECWPRLSGWWGDDKSGRFNMTNKFNPRPGAAGFQLSNPSALDLAAVVSSLQIFNETNMAALRERSIRLTRFLELLLQQLQQEQPGRFTIITPEEPEQRGAQLSIRLKSVPLDPVLEMLDERGVIVDERKPDVIRVAPAPLYNTFSDVWNFVQIFRLACAAAASGRP